MKRTKINGLDYIRVLGILLVISYHLFPQVVRGGFLGVNVLFILSGFLITYHLLDELYENGNIDLKNFYNKRFIRIFPPVLLMVFLTTIFSFFINKDYTVRFFDQFIAAISFNYNIFEIIRGGSYEAQFIKQLFMHTWSLAIEVHFYILWPLLISLIFAKIKNKGHIKRRFSSKFMNLCLGLYLFSYILTLASVLVNKDNIAFIYFFDFTRMGSFVIGSLLGSFVKRFSFKKLSYYKLTLIFSLILLAFSFAFSYNNRLTYGLGFLLADIITVLLIFVAYSNKDLKENKIVTKLSNYSYGIYVFHWPVLVIISSFIDNYLLALLVTVLLTGLLVLFNYHIFEPLFVGKDVNLNFIKNIKINHEKYKILIQSLMIFIFITSMSFAYAVSENSSDMVSLEKTILVESINQDIDKIKLDKEKVDELIKKDEDERYKKAKESNQGITVLADSVLLGNRNMLEENIKNLHVNAEGSRPLENGAEIIRQLQKQGNLGSIVVIALGTNAIAEPKESLENIVKTLPNGDRLIFVTCYDNRYDQPHRVSTAMQEIAKKYDFITLMEWEKEGMAHPEYYKGTDGVHFYGVQKAYDAYLKMLKETIDKSLKSKAKGE